MNTENNEIEAENDVETTTTNVNTSKRRRKTRSEMIADTKAKLEKLLAQEEGTYEPTEGNGLLKRLRNRLRKTNTAFKAAVHILDGKANQDGGYSISPISQKIENAQNRLDAALESQSRANNTRVQLPFDIERLEALVEAAEIGTDVEFPDDLTPLGDEQNRTDAEHEANAAMNVESGDMR